MKIIGHIAYTRSVIIDEPNIQHEIVTLGPVSVLPSFQKQGVGNALIRYSLEKARNMGYTDVCIYGDPRYYSRFGFRCAEKFDIKTADGKFAVALLALELCPKALEKVKGRFCEDPVFEVNQDNSLFLKAHFLTKKRELLHKPIFYNIYFTR